MNILSVVPCSASIVIFSFFNAIIQPKRFERDWQIFCIEFLYDVISFHFYVHKMFNLLNKSLPELLKSLKASWISGFYTNLSPAPRIYAIIQGYLKNFGKIKISC